MPVAGEPPAATTEPATASMAAGVSGQSVHGATADGRYVFLDQVGQGGMGVVHAAWDRKLNRKIALKLVRPERRHGPGQARLLREAQAMAALRHDNVVLVFDVGTMGNDVFVAMEFVEGCSLRAWLTQQPRTWREVVAAFVAAGRGLAAAHAAGLVHRDFKPDNVLVGKDGVVRVADFGLARDSGMRAEAMGPVLGADPAPARDQTTEFVGTPGYMAPEVMRVGRADARSDQYSFAVTLYEALAGRLPFPGKSATDRLTAMDRPPPPLGRQVPGWLRETIARGLAVRAEDRFGSMADLLRRLDHEPRARRRRAFTIAAIVGALVVAGGGWRLAAGPRLVCSGTDARLAGVWDAAARARVTAALTRAAGTSAGDLAARVVRGLDAYGARVLASARDACEAAQIRKVQSPAVMDLRNVCISGRLQELRALADVLARADGRIASSALGAVGALSDASTCDDEAALRRPLALPGEAGRRAQIADIRRRVAEAKARFDVGEVQVAAEALDEISADAGALGYAPAEAEALLLLAVARERATGRHSDPIFRQALVRAEAGGHDEIRSWAASRFAWNLGNGQEKVTEARLWAEVALSVAERIGSARMAARALDALAFLDQRDGKAELAEQRARRALQLFEQADGRAEYGEASNTLTTLAGILAARGKHAESGRNYLRAFEVAERDYGPNHPMTLALRDAVPTVAGNEGRFADAVAGYRALLAIRDRPDQQNNQDAPVTALGLAAALATAGDYQAARPPAARAIAFLVDAVGEEHSLTAFARAVDAAALVGQGRLAEGEAGARKSLEVWRRAPPEDHSDLIYALNVVAQAALERGHLREAAAAIARAHAVTQEHELGEGPELVVALSIESASLLATGAIQRAEAAAQRALAIAEQLFSADAEGFARPLRAVGEAHLARGRAAEAVVPLRRSLALTLRGGPGFTVHPRAAAATRFALARALLASGAERPPALALAEAARDAYRDGEPGRLAIEAWLRRNAGAGRR
jgi:eukaryotic-like serine/threonine-protein kinase